MAVEVWQQLPKNQNDDETIEEAIDRKIVDHNNDADAHLEENQALQSHRANEIIDHIAESVVNDKLKASSRTYVAIVDRDSESDFNDIQDAIDYAATVGGGTVFIKAGTYELLTYLYLRQGVDLIGEGADLTHIQFTTGEASLIGVAPVAGIAEQNQPYNDISYIKFSGFDGYLIMWDNDALAVRFNSCSFYGIQSIFGWETDFVGTMNFIDCYIDGIINGQYISGPKYHFERCTFNTASTAGLFGGANDLEIINCHFIASSPSHLIALSSTSWGRIYIVGCTFENFLSVKFTTTNTQARFVQNNQFIITGANDITLGGRYLQCIGNYFSLGSTRHVILDANFIYGEFVLNRTNVSLTNNSVTSLVTNNIQTT